MLRVLLVDDEAMTRNGLREYMPWSELGMEIAGEAEDGIQAIELANRLIPDLVLCDVRMPRMDGIAFTNLLKESQPSCKVIFLSGYSDAEYLKAAIKLQAVDYVEKPVQIEELTALLRNLGEDIRSRKTFEQELQMQRETWDKSKPDMTARLFGEWLEQERRGTHGSGSKFEELRMLYPAFPHEGTFVCTVIETDDAQGELWCEEASLKAAALELPIMPAWLDGSGVALLALPSAKDSDRFALWLNRMVPRNGDQEGRLRAAGAGNTFSRPALFGESYLQALKALRFRFYRGWGNVIRYRELPLRERSGLHIFDKNQYVRFEVALKNGALEEAIRLLDESVNELLLYPSPDIEAVRQKLFRWYVAITRQFPEAMWEFENDELWSDVFMTGELFKIRQFMSRRLEVVIENQQENKGGKSVIRAAVKYIQQNYNGDASISAIAAHVYLAPTYLCLLFKNEKGISINDYITQLRIEKAKLLLKDRKLKLNAIAQQVGYQDPNYFAKVFRKVTGSNPSEYREAMEEIQG